MLDKQPDEILELIFNHIDTPKGKWFPLLLTCKKFYQIVYRVRDPALKQNKAIRWSCKNGKVDAVAKLLTGNY